MSEPGSGRFVLTDPANRLISTGSPPIYVNGALITVSQWDVGVQFLLQGVNQIVVGQPAEVIAQPVTKVVMSPTHAKVFAEMLTRQVGEWEQKFGALPPTDVLLGTDTGGQS